MFNGKTVKSFKNTDWNETVIEFTDRTLLSINTDYFEGEYETSYYIYDETFGKWIEINKNNL
jgi:hypothetical protein